MTEKEKKTRCKDKYFEKIQHVSFGNEDDECSTLTSKDVTQKEKGDKVGEHPRHDFADRVEACSLNASQVRFTLEKEKTKKKLFLNKTMRIASVFHLRKGLRTKLIRTSLCNEIGWVNFSSPSRFPGARHDLYEGVGLPWS